MNDRIDGMAMIVVHYGGYNELRRDATLRACAGWMSQNEIPSEIIFLEMVLPGQEPCFGKDDFQEPARYLRIYGKERNRNIFEKEAMWNIGAKLTDGETLLFMDGDGQPVGTESYFRMLYDLCSPGSCVHVCHRLIHEKMDDFGNETEFYSCFDTDGRSPKDCAIFPGFGYAMRRKDYDLIDGFNPFSICGSGDVLFISECVRSISIKSVYTTHRFLQGIKRRDLPQLKPVCPFGVTMRHNYHGPKSNRGYVWSRHLVTLFGIPTAYCHIDSAGLVAWNDPDFLLKDMIMEKSRMSNMNDTSEMIMEKINSKLERIQASMEDRMISSSFNRIDMNLFD